MGIRQNKIWAIVDCFHRAMTLQHHYESEDVSLEAEAAFSTAFGMAKLVGWDSGADKEFIRFSLNATPFEMLHLGLIRTLNSCWMTKD
ncbi:hypothetical protein LCGC14_1796670 [marine sediment metagenome]|uniref:Uncharacterized protein n=1 Tax=marine sediment metagenome TaxID=412755 RepID=A0A0F9HDJ5_9ZZZZ